MKKFLLYVMAAFRNPLLNRKNRHRCTDCPKFDTCSWHDANNKCELARLYGFYNSCFMERFRFCFWLLFVLAVITFIVFGIKTLSEHYRHQTDSYVNEIYGAMTVKADREAIEDNAKLIRLELQLIEASGFRPVSLTMIDNYGIFKITDGEQNKTWIFRFNCSEIFKRVIF